MLCQIQLRFNIRTIQCLLITNHRMILMGTIKWAFLSHLQLRLTFMVMKTSKIFHDRTIQTRNIWIAISTYRLRSLPNLQYMGICSLLHLHTTIQTIITCHLLVIFLTNLKLKFKVKQHPSLHIAPESTQKWSQVMQKCLISINKSSDAVKVDMNSKKFNGRKRVLSSNEKYTSFDNNSGKQFSHSLSVTKDSSSSSGPKQSSPNSKQLWTTQSQEPKSVYLTQLRK